MCDESVLNKKFVEYVEQYPCIYDFNRDDHCKRNATGKAWNSIGKEFKLSEVQCKEKWKNLQTAFARSMKKTPSGSAANNKRYKDYYLKDFMQFILPFINVNVQRSNLKVTVDKDEQNSDTDIITDISPDNSDVSLHDETPSTLKEKCKKRHQDMSQDKFTAPNSTTNCELHNMKTSTDEVDKCIIDYITSKKDSQTKKSNSDLDFFKSLLPDIAKMTDYQKRQFKRKTLDTIDSILDDSPTQNTMSYVQRPLHCYSGSSYSVQSPEPPGEMPGFQQLGILHSEDCKQINNNPTTVQNYLHTFTE